MECQLRKLRESISGAVFPWGNAEERLSSGPDMTSQTPSSAFTSYLTLTKGLASPVSVFICKRERSDGLVPASQVGRRPGGSCREDLKHSGWLPSVST